MKKVLYIEIADKIADYVKDNRLLPGSKLPTYREFADLFNVSTHTVGNAVERLHYRGLVDIQPQSGVFIMNNAWNELYPNVFNWQSYFNKTNHVPFGQIRRFADSRRQDAVFDARYVLSNQSLANDFGWHPYWERFAQSAIKSLTPQQLTLSAINEQPRMISAIMEYFRGYGLDLPPGSLYLCKGTNYSLIYIILAFFSPGTTCYFVSPSSMDVSALLDITGIIKVPLPTDSEGIDLEYFSSKIKKGAKSFLIVMPEIPLSGVTMSMKRRRDVYNICYKHSIPIIELDEYRDFHSATLPPIKALDIHGIVFYVGTFARMFSDSIDAGWIAAMPELIERLFFTNISMSIDTEMTSHQTMYEMLVSGEYRKYILQLQTQMRERQRELNRLLDEYLGDIAEWNKNSEVFFWVKFHCMVDVKKMAGNKEGLTLSEYSQYAFAEKNSVLISLSGIEKDVLPDAIRKLSKVARNFIKL